MIPFLFTFLTFFRTLTTLLKDPKFRSLVYLTGLILVVGTAFYHRVEGWRWLGSFYFSVITLATVGYGDFALKPIWEKSLLYSTFLQGWVSFLVLSTQLENI